ncbi:hypothetical protein B0H19DRAFT_1064271 [Mycena capillaripes]|nr:hypothetical protein B0H19DRAFT_1064271 [Mycena capillaripes]
MSISPADVVATVVGSESLSLNLESLLWADFEDALDRNAFADEVASRCVDCDTSHDSSGVCGLRSMALYVGRRRMKTASAWAQRARGADFEHKKRKARSRPVGRVPKIEESAIERETSIKLL